MVSLGWFLGWFERGRAHCTLWQGSGGCRGGCSSGGTGRGLAMLAPLLSRIHLRVHIPPHQYSICVHTRGWFSPITLHLTCAAHSRQPVGWRMHLGFETAVAGVLIFIPRCSAVVFQACTFIGGASP